MTIFKKKKSLIGWMIEGMADTILIFKGKKKPFGNIHKPEYYNAKKVRITIEEIK